MKLDRAARRPTRVVFALLLSICAAPLQAEAGAVYDRDHFHPGYLRVQQKEISRDQAAAIVKQRYGGKILAISEAQRDGRSVYRVKGLSDKSQVYVVYVDKQSGRISR